MYLSFSYRHLCPILWVLGKIFLQNYPGTKQKGLLHNTGHLSQKNRHPLQSFILADPNGSVFKSFKTLASAAFIKTLRKATGNTACFFNRFIIW
tara:strand:- start:808 stop:1089 length:282 start_codon:yes stop_codon:yes gene_type:complete